MKVDKTLIKIFSKYVVFANFFLLKLALELFKHTSIKNYIIDLIDNKQPLYNTIYNLNLMELKIFKGYIKNNLANNSIKSSKFPDRALFFDQKPDKSLRLCVDY